MTAHTLGTCYETPATAGGDGLKEVDGSITGSASYDTGGSVIDLSTVFAGAVSHVKAWDSTGRYVYYFAPAASGAPATGKLKVCGVSEYEVTFDKTSAMFNAAATSDSGTCWAQPVNTVALGYKVVLDEKFAATSLSAVDFEIGLAGDQNGFGEIGTANLFSDAVDTVYDGLGAYFEDTTGLFKLAGETWVMYTSATGADFDTLTAGEITCTFYYLELCNSSDYIGGSANAEVTNTNDLSGQTIYFEAYGTDA